MEVTKKRKKKGKKLHNCHVGYSPDWDEEKEQKEDGIEIYWETFMIFYIFELGA